MLRNDHHPKANKPAMSQDHTDYHITSLEITIIHRVLHRCPASKTNNPQQNRVRKGPVFSKSRVLNHHEESDQSGFVLQISS